jgi:hypothetical protein
MMDTATELKVGDKVEFRFVGTVESVQSLAFLTDDAGNRISEALAIVKSDDGRRRAIHPFDLRLISEEN